MNTKDKKTYLGKKGKIYGPYDPESLKELHRSGEIQNFTFIWDSIAQKWSTLEAAPPSPEGKRSSTTRGEVSWDEVEVFCHDFVHVVKGKLDSVTETGCDLVADDLGEHPRLGVHSDVILNLIQSDQSMNVKATLSAVFREKGKSLHWVYRLEWNGTPSFK